LTRLRRLGSSGWPSPRQRTPSPQYVHLIREDVTEALIKVHKLRSTVSRLCYNYQSHAVENLVGRAEGYATALLLLDSWYRCEVLDPLLGRSSPYLNFWREFVALTDCSDPDEIRRGCHIRGR
jgi:hypothetical protein